MKKNNLLHRLCDAKQEYFTVGTKFGFQRACDFIAIALNSSEVMGKGVMSGERINKILNYAIALDNEYFTAFEPRNPECDKYRAEIDERQKKIFKDKFVPFEFRYKYIKEVKY